MKKTQRIIIIMNHILSFFSDLVIILVDTPNPEEFGRIVDEPPPPLHPLETPLEPPSQSEFGKAPEEEDTSADQSSGYYYVRETYRRPKERTREETETKDTEQKDSESNEDSPAESSEEEVESSEEPEKEKENEAGEHANEAEGSEGSEGFEEAEEAEGTEEPEATEKPSDTSSDQVPDQSKTKAQPPSDQGSTQIPGNAPLSARQENQLLVPTLHQLLDHPPSVCTFPDEFTQIRTGRYVSKIHLDRVLALANPPLTEYFAQNLAQHISSAEYSFQISDFNLANLKTGMQPGITYPPELSRLEKTYSHFNQTINFRQFEHWLVSHNYVKKVPLTAVAPDPELQFVQQWTTYADTVLNHPKTASVPNDRRHQLLQNLLSDAHYPDQSPQVTLTHLGNPLCAQVLSDSLLATEMLTSHPGSRTTEYMDFLAQRGQTLYVVDYKPDYDPAQSTPLGYSTELTKSVLQVAMYGAILNSIQRGEMTYSAPLSSKTTVSSRAKPIHETKGILFNQHQAWLVDFGFAQDPAFRELMADLSAATVPQIDHNWLYVSQLSQNFHRDTLQL